LTHTFTYSSAYDLFTPSASTPPVFSLWLIILLDAEPILLRNQEKPFNLDSGLATRLIQSQLDQECPEYSPNLDCNLDTHSFKNGREPVVGIE
jgi:hypothetical protein